MRRAYRRVDVSSRSPKIHFVHFCGQPDWIRKTDFDTEVAEVGRRSQRERSHPIQLTTDFTDGHGYRSVRSQSILPQITQMAQISPRSGFRVPRSGLQISRTASEPSVTKKISTPTRSPRFDPCSSVQSVVKDSRDRNWRPLAIISGQKSERIGLVLSAIICAICG